MVGAAGEIFRILSSWLPENASELHYCVKFQCNKVLQIKDITNNLTKTHTISYNERGPIHNYMCYVSVEHKNINNSH